MIFAISGCNKEGDEPQNSPPVIQSIKCTLHTPSNNLSGGEQATITVTATDPDNDNLSYSWEADGGNFIDSIDNSTVTWESPITSYDQTYNIKVIVSDGAVTQSESISIYVERVTLCTLNGYAYYASTTIPVSGVQITVDSKCSTSGGDGLFEINDIHTGNRILEATKEGYDYISTNIVLSSGTNDFNVEMTSASYTHNLFGYITSTSDGTGISNCRVAVLNPDGSESQLFTYTSSSGYYLIPTVPQGNRKLLLTEKCHCETQIFMPNSNHQYDAEFETKLTDPRDGKVYDVVEIGGNAWMAENLNYGEKIDGYKNQTNNQLFEKYCYDDNESNCNTYGGLYQWNEMMQYNNIQGARGICPVGWHIPSDVEWTSLVEYLGGDDIAGGKLKEKGTTHWNTPNSGATNESGFSALPGGTCNSYGVFYSLGETTSFWSSTENTSSYAWYRYLYYHYSEMVRNNYKKTSVRSVRCVRD